MDMPKMNREVAIDTVHRDFRIIYFWATQDAVSVFKQFGEVQPWTPTNLYRLDADARYNFDEVVKFIENYGKK